MKPEDRETVAQIAAGGMLVFLIAAIMIGAAKDHLAFGVALWIAYVGGAIISFRPIEFLASVCRNEEPGYQSVEAAFAFIFWPFGLVILAPVAAIMAIVRWLTRSDGE